MNEADSTACLQMEWGQAAPTELELINQTSFYKTSVVRTGFYIIDYRREVVEAFKI